MYKSSFLNISYNEFHISKIVRDACKFDERLYASTGNVILADLTSVRTFQTKLNALFDKKGMSDKRVSAGDLNAMALIDEIFHYMCALYRRNKEPNLFKDAIAELQRIYGKEEIDKELYAFMEQFPPVEVYQRKISAEEYLNGSAPEAVTGRERTNREATLEELVLLHLANEDPAFRPFNIMFGDAKLKESPLYEKIWDTLQAFIKSKPFFGGFDHDLINLLREPYVYSPDSLKEQLDYIRTHWGSLLGDWIKRLLGGIDTISEEQKATWHPITGGDVEVSVPSYESLIKEYERFSPDREWMPRVVLMAKTVLVWLDQLTKKYNRPITTLDQIPDEELDTLRDEGFTGLWLIGLWERSQGSKRIKQICGNPEAAASAYSLYNYEIAGNLGGWQALENLRGRCWARGIRLASDMVPNHTGMDSKWVTEHPDYFIQRRDNPFPQYSYNGENLSHDGRVGVYLEDHYYSKSDCAVVFKRVDNQTGDVRYIYHGNDGTGMPWNDTAQIDFLNPEAREAVIQEVLHVARNFPIIRFDAAMVLAKKHIRRLWYPEPGHGGDIATRSQYSLSNEEFDNRIPNEFWREVVDRVATELPDTLLLAEAFWMMEGYFVRTLGMHRVYNSAFMNMLKKEENQKYRDTVKNTIKFDPQILKRYVNFMNNPDEETAVAQFGKGDKYFGVCTLMITMPGLPMFGHGQIEGFEEKYGMEYTKAYKNESPDQGLVARHWHDIFPLIKKRYLFSGVENFLFYDVWNNGVVNENVFAYSNGTGNERAIVFYNNKYDMAYGWIKNSVPYAVKKANSDDIKLKTRTLAEGLNLSRGANKFCIFREDRSNIWYIRRNDEIFNNGLFVNLKGFESQILLDIHEVVDDDSHKYQTICNYLNGKGSENLQTTWEELAYREIYDFMKTILTEKFYESIHLIFTPEVQLKEKKLESPSLTNILASTKGKVVEFYEIAKKYAGKKDDNIDEEIACKQFCNAIKYLVTEYKQAQGLAKSRMQKISLQYKNTKRPAFKDKFVTLLFRGIQSHEYSAEILASLALAMPLGKHFMKKLAMERKLTEFIIAPGMDKNDIRRIFHKAIELSAVKDFSFGTKQQIKSTYDVACMIASGPESYSLCGANDYDGIKWFNQEQMDESLWYLFASNAMGALKVRREQIYILLQGI
ncbi:MAG: alpha-amylase [Treponema sp.]|nr:alpha-amylase [Treponema sp.]